jgi:hypothetical protein
MGGAKSDSTAVARPCDAVSYTRRSVVKRGGVGRWHMVSAPPCRFRPAISIPPALAQSSGMEAGWKVQKGGGAAAKKVYLAWLVIRHVRFQPWPDLVHAALRH